MSSLVLAVIALLVAFLPVLGIPIAACGLVLGIAGIVVTLCVRGAGLRWGLAGVAVSVVALAVNLALAAAPSNELPRRQIPKPWQPVPDRPYVPPPAQAARQ
jgi:hypothetical protein